MNISVTQGEGLITAVTVRSHAGGGLFTVSIKTPLERRPLVSFHVAAGTNARASQVVEVHRATRMGDPNSREPSRVTLTPSPGHEEYAFDGGLFELDPDRWSVLLVAIRGDLLDESQLVDNWDRYDPGGADYIAPPEN